MYLPYSMVIYGYVFKNLHKSDRRFARMPEIDMTGSFVLYWARIRVNVERPQTRYLALEHLHILSNKSRL